MLMLCPIPPLLLCESLFRASHEPFQGYFFSYLVLLTAYLPIATLGLFLIIRITLTYNLRALGRISICDGPGVHEPMGGVGRRCDEWAEWKPGRIE